MAREWGKGYRRRKVWGPLCDSDHPPCDFKYVHRLHASAVPQDVSFRISDLARSRKLSKLAARVLDLISFQNF